MRLLKRTGGVLIVQLLAFLICTSCIRHRDLRNFTLYNETKKADLSKLKINGVYYTLKKKENYRFRNNDYVKCFILYENGTYMKLFSNEVKSDKRVAINYLVENFESRKKIYSTQIEMWGAYKIVDNKLLIQGHSIPTLFWIIMAKSEVSNHEMEIRNDTTLVELEDVFQNEIPENIYYLFETDRKPDSTNLFMTNKRIKKKLDRLYEKRHRIDSN